MITRREFTTHLGEPAAGRGRSLDPRILCRPSPAIGDPVPNVLRWVSYCSIVVFRLFFSVAGVAGSSAHTVRSPWMRCVARLPSANEVGEVGGDVNAMQSPDHLTSAPEKMSHRISRFSELLRGDEVRTQNPGEINTRASRHRPPFCHIPKPRSNRGV